MGRIIVIYSHPHNRQGTLWIDPCNRVTALDLERRRGYFGEQEPRRAMGTGALSGISPGSKVNREKTSAERTVQHLKRRTVCFKEYPDQ
jgi:hypothetical protein